MDLPAIRSSLEYHSKNLDFDTLAKLSRAARDSFGLGGAVQHGASTLPDVARKNGSARLMIGSDYPHPDGTYPDTVKMVENREGLTMQDKENLLGGTAADFFNLRKRPL